MTETQLHPVARLAEQRIHEGPLKREEAKELFEALARTPPGELAFAATSLLAVATAHPDHAPKLIKLAAVRQHDLWRQLTTRRQREEDRGRRKLQRFHQFLGG